MGHFHMVNHALQVEECTTNLPTNNQDGFQGISWCVHEAIIRLFQCF
jgi:hypothetical protein